MAEDLAQMVEAAKPLDHFLASIEDLEDVPLSEADRKAYQELNLSSCDFVGDDGCTDFDCLRCHSLLSPENLRTLARNLAAGAMLCRAWQLRDENPDWRPGCTLLVK